MKFKRKIAPEIKSSPKFITKKRLREDEINFSKLRSYRLDRVKKELEKNNLEACILFDPVNVRYALDTVNMSVYNMHNLTRYCFVPVDGPTILYEYFNCEILSKHLNLIDVDVFKPVWITDFPMFDYDNIDQLTPMHHPFTAPKIDNINDLNLDQKNILSRKQ